MSEFPSEQVVSEPAEYDAALVASEPDGEPWPGPSREEWQATQDQVAQMQELVAFDQWEAADDEQAAAMADLQDRIVVGDPEALVEMRQMIASDIEAQMAPLREWQQGVETAARLSEAEGE